MDREELQGWLRLALSPRVGPTQARRLLAAFGLPQQIFRQSTDALESVLGPAAARALSEPPEALPAALEKTWQWLQHQEQQGGVTLQRRLLSLADPGYPQALLQIADPPLLLYTLGPAHLQLGDVACARALAVVGSRNPTPQGASDARLFARHLAQAGLTIVSGLALGIDGAAHEGALEGMPAAADAPAATVAVVGTGLDIVYPVRHGALARRIAARGLIVSEFHLGTPPLTPNFPRRNRLISGLSQGTLVVEAALASGSLITARMALEQGREVFAIPGSIHAPQSRGCHALIRQGAKLVESAQDILEELPALSAAPPAAAGPEEPSDEAQDGLLAQMGFAPVSLDALCARTGLDVARLQAALLELELDGQVGRLPGGLFQRIATG
ncbi:DNA-processing protein DprA [Xenophilus arseniciresistens]|uniref:DNA-processing protein DprA n=1 Tax=Xenophilus arseniciresistens TaxID=1283306 RepID=A0AAE3T0Q8_9BURK|nr:DNA-processing protein DprA [Xenophilus arseniciresistens]MDA7418472.1 DNA-processing protein DprA [Xenophilus arseniciresistens]